MGRRRRADDCVAGGLRRCLDDDGEVQGLSRRPRFHHVVLQLHRLRPAEFGARGAAIRILQQLGPRNRLLERVERHLHRQALAHPQGLRLEPRLHEDDHGHVRLVLRPGNRAQLHVVRHRRQRDGDGPFLHAAQRAAHDQLAKPRHPRRGMLERPRHGRPADGGRDEGDPAGPHLPHRPARILQPPRHDNRRIRRDAVAEEHPGHQARRRPPRQVPPSGELCRDGAGDERQPRQGVLRRV